MKYNKSEIMKNAWNLVKTMKITMSAALRKAWAAARNIDTRAFMMIKGWFFNKINAEAARYNVFMDMERIGDSVKVVAEVLRETEKAVYCHIESGSVVGSYKGWNTWIPKSCIVK